MREERKGGEEGKVRDRAYTKSVNSVRDKRNKLTHEKQGGVNTPHSIGGVSKSREHLPQLLVSLQVVYKYHSTSLHCLENIRVLYYELYIYT